MDKPERVPKPTKGKTSAPRVEAVEITGQERDRLLVLDESHYCELKAIEITPAKLTRTLSAFANASGGEIYIGIAEEQFFGTKNRLWLGFKDPEAANAHLQVIAQMFPLGAEYSYEFLRSPGSVGLVLHVTVQKTNDVTCASDGLPYIRQSAQNLPAKSSAEQERLRLDKGVQSFERNTVDVDIDFVSESEVLEQFVRDVVPASKPMKFLRSQSLIKSSKPLVAAVLLFSDEPQAALPKRSAIKLYRYGTTADVGTRETLVGDPRTIEGPLYSLIQSAVYQTVSMVEGIKKLGPKGLEPVTYPQETLHEIVTNAVLHRDYSIAADIQIRVFDNRVEVESPGVLPGHVTIKNMLDEQFARNGALVRLINKFPNPPNKDVGEGLNTAFEAMKRLRLKPPVVQETRSSLVVQIRHEPLATPEQSVMDYLENHSEITNRIARELTGIRSENSMKEVFYRLRDTGVIAMVPDRSQARAAWQKVRHGTVAGQ
ncbi:MAG: putative DNA binding domain-containing protein [Acidobacteria bacterium]|nr:putative DNA binding domain-containing protein [Acidobacteriota bacterium]